MLLLTSQTSFRFRQSRHHQNAPGGPPPQDLLAPLHSSDGADNMTMHSQQTVHSQPAPTMSSVARQIWLSGAQSYIYQYPTTLTHALLRSLTRLKRTWQPGERSQFLQHWSTRVLGLRNFLVGYRPTVASSFIGSAATITVVEVTLAALQRWRDR